MNLKSLTVFVFVICVSMNMYIATSKHEGKFYHHKGSVSYAESSAAKNPTASKHNITFYPITASKVFAAGANSNAGCYVEIEGHKGKVALAFDSVSHANWVAKKDATDNSGNNTFSVSPFGSKVHPSFQCKSPCQYKTHSDGKKISSTVEINQGTLNTGASVTGYQIKANVDIAGKKITGENFIEAEQITNSKNLNTLGGLSLSLGSNSIVGQLKKEKHISKAKWSLYFIRLYDLPSTLHQKTKFETAGHGIATFGEALPVPKSYLQTHQVTSGASFYEIDLASFKVGDTQQLLKSAKVIISTNQAGISLPASILASVKSEILRVSGLSDTDCSKSINNFSCGKCSSVAKNIPSLHFTFGVSTHSITLSPYNFAYFSDSDTCTFSLSDSGYDNTLVIGNSFLQDVYTVFDEDNKTVSFSFLPNSDLAAIAGHYIDQVYNYGSMMSVFIQIVAFLAIFVLFKQ